MDILKLSDVAKNYYISVKQPSLVQGWEKYVCTNGATSIFVKSDYDPKQNEAVFFIQTRNGEVMCQLHKQGMDVNRFTLTYQGELNWCVKDNDTGITIVFYEGLYNETQRVDIPKNLPEHYISKMPTIMKDFADWMHANHRWIAICANKAAHKSVIHKLNNEDWWKTIAAAFNGIMYNQVVDPKYTLASEVYDFIREQNPYNIDEEELMSWLHVNDNECSDNCEEESDDDFTITDAEALEAIHIVQNFWDSDAYDIDDWAQQLLWWPVMVHDED